LIGDGFYGVDLKVIKNKCYVIEINDNPSIEAGYEDAVLKDDLYLTVMRVFRNRIEATH
jgi:glutathione synthase/RimK-type ligase-like ATP-grasp enzyme